MLRKSLLPAFALLLCPAAVASAHHPVAGPASNQVSPRAFAAALTDPCPGDAITPTTVVTGDFGQEVVGSYVFVPFDVPPDTTAVRVKYCYDKPDTGAQGNHTIDLGLYSPREAGAGPWGPDEFRGWGGSSHPDVTVSPEGFSGEGQYVANPKGHVPGKTTRGFRPGPIAAGRWAVELGVPAIVSQAEGDADGKVAWRVEIELSDDPAFADDPYEPVPYPTRAVKKKPGWYAGDLHVHGEHSALGDATMTELLGFAFKSRSAGGAGLDFLTLSDYISGSSWAEIGRYQPDYPGKLIIRSAEVITYRGHLNSHGDSVNMDYRTGRLLERQEDGSLEQVRAAQAPRTIFDRIHAAGGFTQINHPTIFPSSTPGFSRLCRGCPWDYSDADTAYDKVDAWEVHTGPAGISTNPGYRPGPNGFTVTAIARWDELRKEGHRVTAVAVSDSHNAGRTPNSLTQSPIGQGTTVVYADELSEEGVQRAVQLGHAFVKLWASDDPDLRLDAVAPGGVKAMMGDPLASKTAQFTARVLGGMKDDQERRLLVMRDGKQMAKVPVTRDDFKYEFEGKRAGDYRLQLQRGDAIDALTNPITLGASPLKMKVSAEPKQARAGKRTRFVFDVLLRAQDRQLPLAGATLKFAGKKTKTDAGGRATVSMRIREAGRYRAVVTKPGLKPASVAVRVTKP